MAIKDKIQKIRESLKGSEAQLVAVSKYHPAETILDAYQNAGQKVFGESRVQELRDKYEHLPKDIQWHFIGHLQTNKVKYIAPFISLIHSVDSKELLAEIDKNAEKFGRVIECLLEVHIAQEDSKFGFTFDEVKNLYAQGEIYQFKNVKVVGLMGMATATNSDEQVEAEFHALGTFFADAKANYAPEFRELSMGMSGDYLLALKEGSTLVRIGSYIFGERK